MTAPILLVDDRRENLVALQAILEPLGQPLVSVQSGEQALRELLRREYALILLDVQMPVLDGFETARLIKQRERTKHIPIIFLTAISKDAQNVFRGYESGAVDYLTKPFDPDILRSKARVFIELHRQRLDVARREEEVRRREVAAVEAEAASRFRDFVQGLDAIFWECDARTWEFGFVSHHAEELLGYPVERWLDDPRFWGTVVVHPDDRDWAPDRLAAETAAGRNTEFEYRAVAADGRVVWLHDSVVVVPGEDGGPALLRGVMLDITRRKQVEAQQRFLLEAGEALGASLDYRSTLRAVVELAVPTIADWCAVDVLEDGALQRLAVAHVDERKAPLVEEVHTRYPQDAKAAFGPARAIATGEPQLQPEITDEALRALARDDLHLDILRELGLESYVCVPIQARGRMLGALTLVQASGARRYGEDDLALALELARRAGAAVDNAQLYREAGARAQAAHVLASIADGVFLVDEQGVIRLWNTAAEGITGVPAVEAVGQRASLVLPGWDELAARIGGRPELIPFDVGGRELWLSISGVALDEGTAYAFRDLTEERALEELRADFVATVSHELRTPLAAIYGSAQTIRRPDLQLEDDLRNELLGVIAEESDRLANIVNDLLLASHLDSGRLPVQIEQTDALALARSVVESARSRSPDGLSIELRAPARLPRVAADPGQLRQVLVNLVDNAIKYSPEGGTVGVRLETQDSVVRFTVSDEGLGIPSAEQLRIFEKFYRLDPNMTRGIGGTGLGLYICRELVRRVNGSIWVESKLGHGSTFFVDIPVATVARKTRRRAASASP